MHTSNGTASWAVVILAGLALTFAGCGSMDSSGSGKGGRYGADAGAGGKPFIPADGGAGGSTQGMDGGGGWAVPDVGGTADAGAPWMPDAGHGYFDSGAPGWDAGGAAYDGGAGRYDAGSSDAGPAFVDAGCGDAGPWDAGVEPPRDAGPEECVVSTERRVYYMSADDSNSKASAVIARKMIGEGWHVPASIIRDYEFLNYYGIAYAPPQAGDLAVVPQMIPADADPGSYVLQVGVQAPRQSAAERRCLNLTFSLDNSGSMEGAPIENQKAVLRAIASELRVGDVVSAVRWNTMQAVLLDSHAIAGPDDPVLLSVIDGLWADDMTDLDSGLEAAYRLAVKNFQPGCMNRVVVISDGQANVGTTSADLIARQSEDHEREAIYLAGVGTGNGYDDTIMDTLTDRGKGAYLFIDGPAEAKKQFSGDLFVANLEIAAMNIRLRLDLPPGFRVVEFHGEQISGNPREVTPQHLAPNTAMIFHQVLGTCPGVPFPEEDTFTATAEYIRPRLWQNASTTVTYTGAALLRDGDGKQWPQVLKGNAVVAYAEALKDLDLAPSRSVCVGAKAAVANARAAIPWDLDLKEIEGLLARYCGQFGW